MKKKIVVIIVVILIIVSGILIYNITKGESDSEKFKSEYEYYNNKTWEKNNENGEYFNLTINKKNPIKYLTNDNLLKEMTNGNKVIYFGSPDCNWCRMAIDVLLKTAQDNGIEEIYYYNPLKIRDAYEQGKSNEYSNLYEKLEQQMNKYLNTKFENGKNKGKNKITMPTIILIKDGKIKTYHNGTVKTHTNYGKKLTSKQYDELYKIFDDMMIELLMCSTESDCND